MLFSEEKFYREAIDTSIPEMKAVQEAYLAGNASLAEHTFASYIKKTLRPDIYLKGRYATDPTPEEREKTLAAADKICQGILSSVGLAHQFPDNKIDWEINPTFNEYKEWTWQLSRHPEFVRLAVAYTYTKDEKYAAQYDHLITSWITQCECPESISGYATKTWRTIEAGIRMLGSWHFAIHAFLHSPSVSDSDWVLIFRSIYEHAYRLTGFRTSHNWIIMEMGGLINIAVLYPFFRDSAAWYKDGFDSMKEELIKQLYPDDFQYELTTGYHGCNLGNYKNVITLCHQYGITPPKEFIDGLYRMYRFYAKFMRPDGKLPDLNDGSCVDVPQMLKSALDSFPGDPLFTWYATRGKQGKAPDFTSLVMPYSGMTIMRTGWGAEDIWAFFDGGPFGNAHQHEDKLNFELYAYGADMLPDEGCYAYDTSEQRKYVLGTRSHNTGLVDGMGQNRRKTYVWHDEDIEKRATELCYRASDAYEVTESVYEDGYGPGLLAARHHRKVIFFKRGLDALKPFFVLLDDFSANGEHRYEVSFQLPSVKTECYRTDVTARYANGASLRIVSDAHPKLTIGQYEPEYMGWRSIHGVEEHEHEPAPVLSFEKRGENVRFVTLICPSPAGEEVPAVAARLHDRGFVLAVNGKEYTFDAGDRAFDTDPV